MRNLLRVTGSIGALFLILSLRLSGQVSLQIVADNDFALFAGTSTSVTRLVYQNDFEWNDQISVADYTTVNFQPGETTLYLLALGGGGEENISGRINGINIGDIVYQSLGTIKTSGDLSSFLSGFADALSLSIVEAGGYSASLSDVQAGVAAATWQDPSLLYGFDGTVVGTNIYAYSGAADINLGYFVQDSFAQVFRFSFESVGLTPTAIPEPSTTVLALGAIALGLATLRRRRA